MNRRILLAIILPSFFLLSCSVGTDPGECDSLECLPAQYNLHLTLSTDDDEGYSFRDLSIVALFLKPGDRVSFYAESDRVVPEEVSVNGFSLQPPSGPGTFFFESAQDTVLAPAGGYNIWYVRGIGPLPPLIDSIQTPADPLRIVAPLSTDTLSASGDFDIGFEGTVDPSAPILLELYQSKDDRSGGLNKYDTALTTNNSVRITPGLLRRHGIGAGRLSIRAYQRTEQRRRVAPNVRSLLTFSVDYTLSLILKD